MEAVQDKTPEASVELPAQPAPEPTAKAMAAAEEQNAARLAALSRKQQELAEEAEREPVSIIGLAAQGREALLDGLRQHSERAKPVEYIPPPRTARQMAQLEAELGAGRKVQQKAAEQQAHRPAPERDRNEGLTTPVHRPNDFVPGLNSRDPAITR